MKTQRLIGLLALGGYVLVAYTPVANRLARAASISADIQPCDAIVVLGSSMSPDGVLSAASFRSAVTAATLIKTGMAPTVLLLGMRTSSGLSEAAVRGRLVREFGVRSEAILEESRGRTTMEEAALAWNLLAPRGARRILLAATTLHMQRAKAVFERAGFRVYPVPTENLAINDTGPDDRIELMRQVFSEFCARQYYRFTGRL